MQDYKNIALKNGWAVRSYGPASSSSDLAKEALKSGVPEGTAFLVSAQTAGRGRMGRAWSSEEGDGLYLSTCLKPTRPMQDWPSLSFLASLTGVKMVAEATGISADLKWPNDILVNGRKLAGLLLEVSDEAVIIGFGLNLRRAPDLPEAKHPPIDLSQITEIVPETEKLAEIYLTVLQPLYRLWQDEGPQAILDKWQAWSDPTGREMRVSVRESVIEGRCIGLDKQGALILEAPSGERHIITTGDVQIMGQIDAAGH